MRPRIWISMMLLLIVTGVVVFMVKTNRKPATEAVVQPAVTNTQTAGFRPLNRHSASQPQAQGQGTDNSQAVPSQSNLRHLQLVVEDEMGQPIAGAEVRTKINVDSKRVVRDDYGQPLTTDSLGGADVLWPGENLAQLEVAASKKDYASRKMVWDLKTGDIIPASLILKLRKGLQVGGIVVDPEGHPVSDAKVSIYRFWNGGERMQTKGEDAALSRQERTTGADGRWSMDNLPSELVNHMMGEASHKDFIAAHITLDEKNVSEMQKGNHKFVLTRGLEAHGRVFDEQGNPVADARVWAGKKFYRERQETKTDAAGGFSFRNLNEGSLLFSAMADGLEPTNRSYTVGPQTPEIVFHLKKGSVIAGIVQTPAGEPIQGVRVSLAGFPGQPAYDAYEFSTNTDEAGRFAWLGAPSEPMPFYFGKVGYEQKRNLGLQPGKENVITLRPLRKVVGQVFDSETGNPVTNFCITLGREFLRNVFSADSHSAKDFTSADGSFTMNIDEETVTHIEAAATEYAEQSQKLPDPEGDQVQVVFRLKPSKPLQGVVLSSDGQPVAGVTVAIVSDIEHQITLGGNGKLQSYSSSRSKMATTDESGQFQIPSPPDQGTVIASKADGFASAPIAQVKASGKLILDLYGRIEGTVIRGIVPAEGQELLLSNDGGMTFDFSSYKVAADANGQFAFDKVPAGKVSIVRLVKTSTNSWTHSHATEVTVEAGKTTQVTLGGVDATLSGHVTFETDQPAEGYTLVGNLSTLSPKLPDGLTQEQVLDYVNSPAWKEQTKNRRSYSVAISSDGALTLDSVAPGNYTLKVTASPPGAFFLANPLAEAEMAVTVPSGSGPSAPINIGEIVLKPQPKKP